MVATSLPFWMQNPNRSMSPFPIDAALRLGPLVARNERRLTAGEPARPARTAGLSVELCDAQAVVAYEEAWSALARRAIEPNVFLEPGFAMPAIRHFPPAHRPLFLLVWSTGEHEKAALVGLCALKDRPTAYGLPLSAGWTHEQATLNAPLLDRACAAEALDALLTFLAERSSLWSGLLLSGVSVDGPLMRLLAAHRHRVVEQRSRPVLHNRETAADPDPVATGHHEKELKRLRRRLDDSGSCVARSARSPDEVRLATEQFLHLEARGWKGGRGTALLSDAGLAAFTRAMTRQLARSGLCRIDSLEIDNQPVAMSIVIRSGDRSFFWKTSYDERWKRFSPGKQLAAILREIQLADPSIALTDSCAVPDHPMISHVWRGRMTVADLLVAPACVETARLEQAARRIGRVRACRGALKALYTRLRRTAGRR